MTAKLIIVLTMLSPLLLLAVISCVNGQPQHQQQPQQLQNHQLESAQKQQQAQFSYSSGTPRRRVKRMYAVCPPEFQRIGNECYFISKTRETWMDAHFKCVDRDSKLAEPFKFEDKRLRKYLLANDGRIGRSIRWIGGIYNWESHNWHWAHNGRNMTYKAFSRMHPGGRQNLMYHCTVLNPDVEYRWSARPCTDANQYVCQHRMPYVNKRQLDRVYARWNVTYPNQFANQMEVIVTNPNNKLHNQLIRNKQKRKIEHGSRQGQNNNVLGGSEPADKPRKQFIPNPPGYLYGGVNNGKESGKRRRPLLNGPNGRRLRKRPMNTTTVRPAAAENEIPLDLAEIQPETLATTTQRHRPVSTTLSTTTTSTEAPTTMRTTTEYVQIPIEHHPKRHHNHYHHRTDHEQPEQPEHKHPGRHRHHHEESRWTNEIGDEKHSTASPTTTTTTTSSTTTTTTPAPPTTPPTTSTTTVRPETTPSTTTTSTPSPVVSTTEKAKESNAVQEKTAEEKREEKLKRVEELKRKFNMMTDKQKALFIKLQKQKLHKKQIGQGN